MNLALVALPYTPPANPDELLSSWIERIGLFYGIGFLGASVMLEPSRVANARAKNEDVDASGSIRRALVSWTGFAENSIPRLLPSVGENILEVSARLTYCPKCWNEDVKLGRSPYIRRSWANWSCVLCAIHRTWLSAREPGYGFGSELNGWASTWQTDVRWASAAHVQHDPELLPFSLGFEGHGILHPSCNWTDLEFEIDRLTRENPSPLRLVLRPHNRGLCDLIWQALGNGEPSPRITDAHLRGYHRSEPGWIAGRISCLIVATEIARMASDQKPAFSVARTLLEAHPAARRLVHDWRILRSHNSRQFSADAGDIPPSAGDEQSHLNGSVREPMPTGAYNLLIKRRNPYSQFLAGCQ